MSPDPLRPRASIRPWLVGVALAWITSACGALDASAPQLPPAPPPCPTVDDRLEALLDLVAKGQLRHIAALVSDQLDEASRRALLRLLLDVGAALPAGRLQQVPDLLEQSGVQNLLPIVLAILEPLPGVATAKPPVPPKIAEMTAFSKVSRTCLDAPLFQLLTDLQRDPALAPALDRLLADAGSGLPQLRKALQGAGKDGRASFVAIVRNTLTSLAHPQFDPQPLLDTLAALRDPATPGPIDALHDILTLVAYRANGQPAPDRIAAVSGFAACCLAIDPQGRVAGHAWDVLVAGPPLGLTPPPPGKSRTAELLQLTAFGTEVLARQQASRDALGQVLGLVLRPDIAVLAVPELVVLLRSDAVAGLLAVVRDLLLQPCRGPDDV